MNDPLVLILFLATWGGIALLFRRLADDFRKATVRQSDKPAQIDEELLRITGEVQETIEGLSDAIGKRAEQLRTLIAEADTRIEALSASLSAAAASRDIRGFGGRANNEHSRSESAGVRGRLGQGAASEAPEPELGGSGERSLPRSAEPQTESPPSPTPGRAPSSEVLRLHAEGHDPDTIARLTNRGREEVRLLLGTRR